MEANKKQTLLFALPSPSGLAPPKTKGVERRIPASLQALNCSRPGDKSSFQQLDNMLPLVET